MRHPDEQSAARDACQGCMLTSAREQVLKRVVRCAAGKITGDMRVSGYPKVQETFARVIGYVEQSDIHSAHVRPSPHPLCTLPCLCIKSAVSCHALRDAPQPLKRGMLWMVRMPDLHGCDCCRSQCWSPWCTAHASASARLSRPILSTPSCKRCALNFCSQSIHLIRTCIYCKSPWKNKNLQVICSLSPGSPALFQQGFKSPCFIRKSLHKLAGTLLT